MGKTDTTTSALPDLTALSADIRCLTGAPDCRCEGCGAVAAVHLAAEHLEAGRLLDASVKLGHAAWLLPTRALVQAAAELEQQLLALTCSACGAASSTPVCSDCEYRASLQPEWLAGAEVAVP